MGQEGEETHPTIWVLRSPESAPPDCWICWRCAAPGPPPRTPDGERTEDRQGLRAGLTWNVLYSWTVMILNLLWVWPRITLIIVCFLSTTGQTLLGQIRGVTGMVPGWGWGWGVGGFFPAVHQARWWVWNHVSVLMSPDLATLSEFFCFLINQVKHHYHFSQLICAEQLQAATPTLGTTDLNPVQTDFGEKKSKTRVDFFSFKNNFFSCLKNPPTLIHWQQRKLVFSNK